MVVGSTHDLCNARQYLSAQEDAFWLTILLAAKCVLFCTFTFRGRVTPELARKKFESFIRLYSSRFRYNAHIAYVYGLEDTSTYLSAGESSPHLHAILISNAQLDAESLQQKWNHHF